MLTLLCLPHVVCNVSYRDKSVKGVVNNAKTMGLDLPKENHMLGINTSL